MAQNMRLSTVDAEFIEQQCRVLATLGEQGKYHTRLIRERLAKTGYLVPIGDGTFGTRMKVHRETNTLKKYAKFNNPELIGESTKGTV